MASVSKKRQRTVSASSDTEDAHEANQLPGWRRTDQSLHITTSVESDGLGTVAQAVPGRRTREQLFDLELPRPKWIPPVVVKGIVTNPTAAVLAELERDKQLHNLRQSLTKLCKENGINKVPLLAFERWRFAAKWAEEQETSTQSDSVIPYGPGVQAVAEKGLVGDLERAGVDTAKANSIALQLAKAAKSSCATVRKIQQKAQSNRNVKCDVNIEAHKHTLDFSTPGCFVKLNKDIYEKLCLMYDRNTKASVDESERILRIYALLVRYKAIQGHGFQAATGPPVFSLLHIRLEVAFECFGSPLNTFFGSFCSAFPDVDGPFGSSGSFFKFQPIEGSYQCNPPFVPCIIDCMVQHLIVLLLAATNANRALSFVVFLPGWLDSLGYQQLLQSEYLRKHVTISATDHGYTDGAAHQHKDSYRRSPYDTSVFFVQSDKASRRWTVSEELLKDLRQAMADCVPLKSSVRRQIMREGGRKDKAIVEAKDAQDAAVHRQQRRKT